jgi:hypothetical protein
MTINEAIQQQFAKLVEQQNRTFEAFPPDRRQMQPCDFEASPDKATELQVLFRHRELPLAVEMVRSTVFHPWELVLTLSA